MKSLLHGLKSNPKKISWIFVALAIAFTSSPALALTCDSGTKSGTCTITSNQSINAGTTESFSGDLVIDSGGIIFNQTNNHSFALDVGGNFTMRAGSEIRGNVNVSASYIDIQDNAKINASRLGYRGGISGGQNGQGPGAGRGSSAVAAGGGGYGGIGGTGTSSSQEGGDGGTSYGQTIQPSGFGSGGGAGDFTEADGDPGGGDGGGRIILNATYNTSVNGSIVANGEDGSQGYNDIVGDGSNPGGGGAGGTIQISGNFVTGEIGGVNATGGDGGVYEEFEGGGGAGGRVSFIVDTFRYRGALSVIGGQAREPGGTGTLYPFAILCDEGTVDTECIVIDTAELSEAEGTGDLIIRDGGKIQSEGDLRLNFSKIQLENGGNLSAGDMNFSGTDFMNVSGLINSTGRVKLPSNSQVLFNNSKLMAGGIDGSDVNLSAYNYSLDIKAETGNNDVNFTEILSPYAKANADQWITSGYMNFSRRADIDLGANDIIIPDGFIIRAEELYLTARNILVNPGGRISGDEKGYKGGTAGNPGNGPGGTDPADGTSGGAGGAAFAGTGGDGGSGLAGGTPYGQLTSNMMGSGGGGGAFGAIGGNGGGIIDIEATSTLTLNGTITSDGGNGNIDAVNDAGAGAGGNVLLRAGELAGRGTVTARGGDGTSNSGGGGAGRVQLYYGNNLTDYNRSDSDGDAFEVFVTGGGGANSGETGTIMNCENYGSTSCPGIRNGVNLDTNTDKSSNGMYLIRELGNVFTDSYLVWEDNETRKNDLDPAHSGSVSATYTATGLKQNYLIKAVKDGVKLEEKNTTGSGDYSFTTTIDGASDFYLAEGYNPEVNPGSDTINTQRLLMNDDETNDLSFTARDNQSGIDKIYLRTDEEGSMELRDWYTKDLGEPKDLQNVNFNWRNNSEYQGTSLQTINWEATVKDLRHNNRTTATGSFQIDGENPFISDPSPDATFDVDIDNPYTTVEYDAYDSSGKTLYNTGYDIFKSVDMMRVLDRTNTSGNYSMTKKSVNYDLFCRQGQANASACENAYRWEITFSHDTLEDVDMEFRATDKAGNIESFERNVDWQNITVSHSLNKSYVNSTESIALNGDSILLPNNEDPNGNRDLPSDDHGYANVYVSIDNGTGGYKSNFDTGFRLNRYNQETYCDQFDCDNSEDDGLFRTRFTSKVAGTHQLRTIVIDDDNVQGQQITNFNVSLDIINQTSNFSTPTMNHLDVDSNNHNLNLSSYLTRSTDSAVDKFLANITTPSGVQEYYLNNNAPKTQAHRWNLILNTTEEFGDELGTYNVEYSANTTRGIGSDFEYNSFFIQNITSTLNLGRTLVSGDSTLNIDGRATLQPNGTLLNGSKNGSEAKVFVDGSFVKSVSINSTGDFDTDITTPRRGGSHTVTVEPVNQHGIDGTITKEFFVAINPQNPKAISVETGNSFVDANEDVNTTVHIPSNNLNVPELNISHVQANVTLPNGTNIKYQLKGEETGGLWYGVMNTTDLLDNHAVTFHANLTNGFSEQFKAETSFKVQNLTTTQKFEPRTAFSNEPVEVSGFVTRWPDNVSASGNYELYRDKGYGQSLIDSGSLNGSGGYSHTFQTAVAGTHFINTSVVNPNGIDGYNLKTFNVTLDLSNPEAIYPETGIDYLDIDKMDHSINISTFVTNSTDSNVSEVTADIERPFQDSSTEYNLGNTTFKNRSQVWYTVLNTDTEFGDLLGEYEMNLDAETERGIGSNTVPQDFFLQNLSISQSLDSTVIDWDDSTTMSGTVLLEPNNTGVDDTLNIFLDGEQLNTANPDSNGDYDYLLNAPDTAGKHQVKLNTTNPNGIDGENQLEFDVRIAIQNEKAHGVRTGNEYVNPREDVNLSIKVPEFNVPNSTTLSVVQATVENSTGHSVTTESLSGSSDGGTWNYIYTDTPELGNYTVTYNAILGNGYSTQQTSEVEFKVRNATTTQILDKRYVNSSENISVSGESLLRPVDNPITTKIQLFRNTRGSWDLVRNSSLNILGQYDTSFETAVAGTHLLRVNVTDQNGITGYNETKFNVSLDVSEEKSSFQNSGTRFLDVDLLDHELNLSAFVSNSTDADVDTVKAKVTDPSSGFKSFNLANTSLRNRSGYWYNVINTTEEFSDELGTYSVEYSANTTRGIGSNFPISNFTLDNITLTQRLDKSQLDQTQENLLFNGTAVYQSDDSPVTGETVRAFIDGSPEGSQDQTDGSGFYEFEFSPPAESGRHNLTVKINDTNDISGTNTTQFDVLINLQNPAAVSRSTTNTHANIGDTIDLSVEIPSYTIADDKSIDYVKAEIEKPGSPASNTTLSGPSGGGTFSETYSQTGELGQYNVTFYAELNNSFSEQLNSSTSFSVENLSIQQELSKNPVNSNENLTISGDATLQPFGTPANGTVKIYRNTTGNFEHVGTTTLEDGSYSKDIQTAVAGTHDLVVNVTNPDGINGTNKTRFNTTLDISNTQAIFEGTGTSTLDVKNDNANLNISGFLSNTTDSQKSHSWVLIDLPGGATDRIFLNNLDPKDESGTWSKIINVSSRYGKQSGAYTATYYANTTRGIGSNNPTKQFFIQSIKITEFLDKRILNPGETFSVNGTAELVSDNSPVANQGVTVSIDGSALQPDPVTSTNGSGFYEYTMNSPETAGVHDIRVNTTNDEDVTGFNTTEFETRINLTNGFSDGEKTGNPHVNLDENVSISVTVPSSNIDGSQQLDMVRANITRPNGSKKTLQLSGDSSGGEWSAVYRNATALGIYDIEFGANLTTGFSRQINESAEFSVENVTLTETIEDRTVNSMKPMNVSGYATLRPNSTGAPGNFKITRYVQDDSPETVATGSLNSSGGYNATIRTAIAGTHRLEINVTTPSGINGTIDETFNTTLNVSDPKTIFQKTETPVVDVDSNNSVLNLSAFVSNSSTGFVYDVSAEIEAPDSSTDTVTLDPEISNSISNTWENTYNTSENFGDLSGRFNVTFSAETDRGIGSNLANTSFYVKNVSITQNLNDSDINPNDTVEISGKVLERPSMSPIENQSISIMISGTEVASTTTEADGTYIKRFDGPVDAGDYTLRANLTTSESISGANSTRLSVYNLSSTTEPNTSHVFRDTDPQANLEFDDTVISDSNNPGDINSVTFSYDVPIGFDPISLNSLLGSFTPGQIKDNDPVYDVSSSAPLGLHNITASGSGNDDIRTASQTQVTVWSKSDAALNSPPSVVSRSSNFFLLNATIVDGTTGSPLSNISTNFTVDGTNSEIVETNGTGVATFNWSLGDYNPGEHTISVKTLDEPDKYINSSGVSDSATIDISGKIRLTDYSSINNPIYRMNGSSPDSTVFNIRLIDSGNDPIEDANVSFKINGTTIHSLTDSNGYVSKSYNPRDSIEANNYTVNITAKKQNYSTVNRNESIVIRGILDTVQNSERTIYRRGVAHEINLTVENEFGEDVSANTTWKLNETDITSQISENEWTPSIVEDLGPHNLTSETSKDFFRTDVESRDIQVYGNAEIDVLDPPTSDLLPNNSYNLTTRVVDSNISTGVSNMPVNLTINNTGVFDDNSTNYTEGFNTTVLYTDGSGYARFNWTPEKGNYSIESTIENNESLKYNATVTQRSSNIEIDRVLYFERLEVSEEEIFRNDTKDPHTANFTVELEETSTTPDHVSANDTQVRFLVGGQDALFCTTNATGICEVRYNASEDVPSGNVTVEASTDRDNWNNPTATDGLLIKDSLRATILKPEEKILNRGTSVLLNVTTVSDGQEVPVAVDWDFRGNDIGQDQKTTQWSIPETEARGNGSLQLTASGDTYGTDIATENKIIYGLSSVNFTSQSTVSNRFEVSENPEIRCNVYNNLDSPISGYPVSFQSNGTEYATDMTGANGDASAEFDVPNKLSTFNLSCGIDHNETLLYNTSIATDSKEFVTSDNTDPEIENLTISPEEIQPGDSFNITFNAFDTVGVKDVKVEVKNINGETENLEIQNRSGYYYANYTTTSGVSGTYEIQATATDTSNNTGFSITTVTADPGGDIELDPADYTVQNMTYYENRSFRTELTFIPENTINYTNITTSTASNSSPLSFNASKFSCGNISSGENCTTSFNISIDSGTSQGTFFGIFTAEWINLNQSERNTIKEIIPIEIATNPVLREEYGNWRADNTKHGTSAELLSTFGGESYEGFILNSTGNEPVENYRAEFEEDLLIPEDERLKQEWVNLKEETLSSLEPGEIHTTGINVSVPAGTVQGDYNGTIIFRADNTGNLRRNISVEVPKDPSFNVLEEQVTTYAVVNQSYLLEKIDVENDGNINLTAETLVSGNASNKVYGDSTDLRLQETSPIAINYRNFTNNKSYWANITFQSEDTYLISGTPQKVKGESDVLIKPVRFDLTLNNQSQQVDAKPGKTLTADFNVKVRGEDQTENLSFNPVVNQTSGTIISQNGTNGSFNVDFQMPDLADGKLYDFKMMVNETQLNVTTWDEISDKYYIPDVTDPEIINATADDQNVGNEVTINATVIDNHYQGVRNVTFTVTKPSGNQTVFNSTLVRDNWIYTIEPQELEGEGDYNVDVLATDPAGNQQNTSTMFRYSNNTDFSGSFVDASGTPQKANFTFRDSDTDKVLQRMEVNSQTGNYNATLLKGSYDIEIEYSNNNIKLDNAKINDSVSEAVKLDEISSIPSIPYADPDHNPNTVVMALGGKSNLSVETAEIELNYDEYSDRIAAGTRDELIISRCKDYDYDNIECDGDYELYNLTNSSFDNAEGTVTISTDGFSVYSLFIPGSDFMEEPTSEQTGAGGGGGGGGPAPATQENVSEIGEQLSDLRNPLEIQDQRIDVSMQPNESTTRYIRILNRLPNRSTFRTSITPNVQQFVDVAEEIDVENNSLAEIRLNISINGTPEHQIYRGGIDIEGAGTQKNIPVVVRIEERETYVAGDSVGISINPEQNTVNPGNNLSFRLRVTPSRSILGSNITLDYFLRRPGSNGEVLVYKNNIEQFDGLFNGDGEINVPGDTETGEYVLEVRAAYPFAGEVRTSSSIVSINVQTPFFQRTFLGITYQIYLIIFLALLIGGGGGYKGYVYYQEYLESQKRYKQEIDKSSLPGAKAPGGTAYLGNLADRKDDAYMELDALTTHALVAGATGSGKSVTGQAIVEEALENGVNVIVLDPTAQWSGYLRKCTSDDMLKHYSKFNMSANDARAYDGNIRAVNGPDDEIDIKYLLQNDDQSGSIVTFSLHKLESKDIESFASSIIEQVFEANCSEREHLDTLIVFDEAHRLLEKFGGSGDGLNQLERGAREFRKWGVGMLLLSQVISDFPSEIRTNVGTKIQMRTRNQDDLDHYKDNYGMDTVRSIVKANVGSGMIQNSDYNGGNPYFVNFRPLKHSVHRLSDDELDKYEEYNRKIDDVEEKIQKMEDNGEEVYEYRSNLKLCRKNLRKGSFNLVDIYLDELQEQLEKA